MKPTREIIEVAQKYRIEYESPQGRDRAIREILSGEHVFCETFGKECHSFHPVKGRKSRRIFT